MNSLIRVRKVSAIHPQTGEIVIAYLYPNHFGPAKDAIRFSTMNGAYHSADSIVWEKIKP